MTDGEIEVLPVKLEAHEARSLFRTDDPAEIVERAASVAKSLAPVIRSQRLYASIQGRDHVRVEGWTLLGSMLGVFPVCVWSKPLPDGAGWEARVEARTLSGAIVGAAEASCTRDERNWSDRDEYALRSMAQTRATSKALRLPLGFVVTMAGYDATPAEEMPREAIDVTPRKQPQRRAPQPPPAQHPAEDNGLAWLAETIGGKGQNKDKTWAWLSEGSFGGKRMEWADWVLGKAAEDPPKSPSYKQFVDRVRWCREQIELRGKAPTQMPEVF